MPLQITEVANAEDTDEGGVRPFLSLPLRSGIEIALGLRGYSTTHETFPGSANMAMERLRRAYKDLKCYGKMPPATSTGISEALDRRSPRICRAHLLYGVYRTRRYSKYSFPAPIIGGGGMRRYLDHLNVGRLVQIRPDISQARVEQLHVHASVRTDLSGGA